ncbi:MAG TPA: UDP-3-O-(3-hydroxymyristoyl)glucosamine N-acyltransferase [Firmicutes bacterium]|nr:UDP-3-O-(3-hydroxymyristoyl)glucosamine N-acyltransferase [Bacillota bacterium]
MTKVISASAQIEQDVEIGEFAVIEKDVIIGPHCRIGHHAVICEGAVLGADVEIGIGAVVGKRPRPARTSTVKVTGLAPAHLGDGCILGTYAAVYAGSVLGSDVMVADHAVVRERCRLGANVVVGRAATVENDTEIGARTKIQTGAYVTAYMTVEEDVFIAPMVTTTNDNYMGRTEKRFSEKKGATIRKGARIGGNAILLPGIEIGAETLVAAGSVVTKDTAAGQVVMGVPARAIRPVTEDELLKG